MSLAGKKILYLITQSKFGGAQKYVLDLARHFSQNNEVGILVGEKNNLDPLFFKNARAIGIEPVMVNNLIRDISLVKAFEASLELRKILTTHRPDIVHLNSTMAGVVGSFASWLYNFDPLVRGARVVYTAHGFVFNESLSAARRKMYLLAEKTSAAWKHHIITISHADKQAALRHRLIPPVRLSTVHNGINTATEFLSREESRATLEIPSHTFAVGTIASLYKTKGIEFLIHAAHHLMQSDKNSHFTFHIIGDGPERITLQNLTASLGVGSSVFFHGAIQDASRLLPAFNVFALPSAKEGLPYTILEAGLAGVPVIASRVGGIPDIIEHEENGYLIEPARPEELVRVIQLVADDPVSALRKAALLRTNVLENFSLERMLEKTEAVYLNLTR